MRKGWIVCILALACVVQACRQQGEGHKAQCAGQGAVLEDFLTRYYESGLFPEEKLYYHYNEMQGMEEGGIYFAEAEDDLIPKLMLQLVKGVHLDKILLDRNGDWGYIYKQTGVPLPPEGYWDNLVPMDSFHYTRRTARLFEW